MKKFRVYVLSAAAAFSMLGAVSFPAYAAVNTYSISGGKVMVIGQNAGSGCNNSNFQGISLPGNPNSGCGSLDCFLTGGTNSGCQTSGCQGSVCTIPGCTDSGCQLPGIIISGGSGNQNPGTSNSGGSGSQTPGTSNPGGSNSQKPGTSNPGNSASSQDSFAAEVVNLVNEERAKAGLAPLTVNTTAATAAMTRAKEIATSFSHTRPNGSSFSTALTEAGVSYRSAGENIAYGQTSPAQVMNGWMNSSGHRANILNSSYTEIGVAHYKTAAGTDYWVQLFLN